MDLTAYLELISAAESDNLESVQTVLQNNPTLNNPPVIIKMLVIATNHNAQRVFEYYNSVITLYHTMTSALKNNDPVPNNEPATKEASGVECTYERMFKPNSYNKDFNAQYALVSAVEKNDPNLVESVLQNNSALNNEPEIRKVLIMAHEEGARRVIEYCRDILKPHHSLIDAARCNLPDSVETILQNISLNRGYATMEVLTVARKHNAHRVIKYCGSVFAQACRENNLKMVKSLIKAKFDVNINSGKELNEATATGKDELVRLLVNAGCNAEL